MLRQVQEIATRQLEQCALNEHTLHAITAYLLGIRKSSRSTNQGKYIDNSDHTDANNNDKKLIGKS